MTRSPRRMTLLALLASLALVACSERSSTRPSAANHPPTPVVSSKASHRPSGTEQHEDKPVARQAHLPSRTGIPACDDYLSSYLACHRAAAIFPPSQLQARYEAMRINLLRDSMDPKIRPHLAARCNALATQLRQALHGKSCDVNPAPNSSSP
jgi:hypothetical protein